MLPVALAFGAVLALASPAAAQSLSPMERVGVTPTDTKGFKLLVGNPYSQRMTFTVIAMDPEFTTEIEGAVTKPARNTLAPGRARSVIAAFKIDPAQKERTIGVCIMPENFEGPVLPRVCRRYTGRML